MAFNNPTYIGIGDQRNKVSQRLTQEFQTNPRGIFIIAGGPMVGKDTTVSETMEKTGLDRWDTNRYELRGFDVRLDDFKKIGFDRAFTEAYEQGRNEFALGEVILTASNTFAWLQNFYQKALSDGRNIKIIFNVISKEHPPWRTKELKKDLEAKLRKRFPRDLHLFILDADKERIAQEAWRLKTTDEGQLDTFAEHLGFNTKSLEWYAIEEAANSEELTSRIRRLMDSQTTSPFKERK